MNIVAQAFQDLLASTTAAEDINVGDQAPEFELPSVKGGSLSLQEKLPDICAAGARLIAVSPGKPDASLSHADKLNLEFDVLCDRGNRIARNFGLVTKVHESMRPLYLHWGVDVPAANGDNSYELPVPATYVTAVSGEIRAAYVDKDYTKRMEPDDIIDTLNQL